MEILLHTIALEPARWTPERVSQPLLHLLPHIAASGFKRLEIYEPHLQNDADWPEIATALAKLDIRAVILSSYLNLRPAVTSDEDLERQTGRLKSCLDAFGFSKVRIFPGAEHNEEGIRVFKTRLRHLSGQIPDVEILLETHDGSLADDPALLVRIVEELALPNVGLLYQPTFFEARRSIEQFHLQKPFIRHLHLQGRRPDFSVVALKDGLFPWSQVVPELDAKVNATLEFVSSGICPVERFDLAASLKEARAEVDYVRKIEAGAISARSAD